MKLKTTIKAKGLAAFKLKNAKVNINLRNIDTGVDFGKTENGEDVKVQTDLNQKGIGTFDFDTDWS